MKLFEISQRHQPVDDWKAFAEKYCGDALRSDVKLLRSSDRESSATLRAPLRRESLTGSNVLMDWASNDPPWKPFPRRDRSVSMVSNQSNRNFGNHLYRVLPMDGDNLGVCPLNDFNSLDGFEYGKAKYDLRPTHRPFEILTTVGVVVERGLKRLKEQHDVDIRVSEFDNEDGMYSELMQLFGVFNKLLQNAIIGRELMKEAMDVTKYSKIIDAAIEQEDIIKVVSDMFDPQLNKFQTATMASIDSIVGDDVREVWTSSHCLIVPFDDYSLAFR